MEMLSELQAERQLLAIEAASVPHMDQRGRQSVIRRYERRIGSSVVRAKSAVEALMQSGVSMVITPPSAQQRKAMGRAGTRRKGERG